jgi:hypothetical protein
MNKQELIERYESYEGIWNAPGAEAARKCFLRDLKQLEELSSGRAEEAPRYVKNILARLRELPLHDREVWLKAIMSEFERDFSHAIWREGYKQGKFEGEWVGQQLKDADKIRRELNRVKIPEFAADVIEGARGNSAELEDALFYAHEHGNQEFKNWYGKLENRENFARALLDGYEVEKEKRYEVLIKASGQYLARNKLKEIQFMYNGACSHFTRKELEEAGFGWFFSCEGVEVKEVDE